LLLFFIFFPFLTLVPDLDMAGARGSAIAAKEWAENR